MTDPQINWLVIAAALAGFVAGLVALLVVFSLPEDDDASQDTQYDLHHHGDC